MWNKLAAIVMAAAFLAWPGSFGSIAVGGDVPLIEEGDVRDAGQFQVYVITGVSAKRMFNKYGAAVLIDEETKTIVILKVEA